MKGLFTSRNFLLSFVEALFDSVCIIIFNPFLNSFPYVFFSFGGSRNLILFLLLSFSFCLVHFVYLEFIFANGEQL